MIIVVYDVGVIYNNNNIVTIVHVYIIVGLVVWTTP